MKKTKFIKYSDKEVLEKIDFLELLAKQYPNIQSASSEIINLNSILSLPKGTEHFLSDIHGEYKMFTHILNSASGVVKRKIKEIYEGILGEEEINQLATLIYYPEEKIKLIKAKVFNINTWYYTTIIYLIEISKSASTKFTRSKMRKYLPKEFAYIIEELMNNDRTSNKEGFYKGILDTIIDIGRAEDFIIALSSLIRKIVIDRLHIIGDIFDRGPRAAKVMDTLVNHHSVDIQWGNHDTLWIGAAIGIYANIANLLRISTRYDNCATIETGYGISLTPLVSFAFKTYDNDNCDVFMPKLDKKSTKSDFEINLLKKMHKAITVIQFKLEAKIINRNPSFNMQSRLLLDKIDGDEIMINNKRYKLKDNNFPTIDKNNPYKLTEEEEFVIKQLKHNFMYSKKLQDHIKFLIDNGSMYLSYNSNLLYHGCIPLDDDGNFSKFSIGDKTYSGKSLFDKFDSIIKRAYSNRKNEEQSLNDLVWYLWCGKFSPLFGKKEMTTFERYFIEDKSTHEEGRNAYYNLRDDEIIINKILKEFGLKLEGSYIINGHVPVKVLEGETPIFGNGKLIVIDGGLSKTYQKVTGIAGYTLIYNSYNMLLVAHKPFEKDKNSIENDEDIISDKIFLQNNKTRKTVGETDIGNNIRKKISKLDILLTAYRKGIIKES